MALTNHERVGRALDLLRDGLHPFVERELRSRHGERWTTEIRALLSDRKLGKDPAAALEDVAGLLLIVDKQWGQVFGNTLGRSERNIVLELGDIRNRWAHQERFSGDDAYRALDSSERLLTAIAAEQAEEVGKLKAELLRIQFEERNRYERRRSSRDAVESPSANTLRPWREVVTPHSDVASGNYQQAEFAADLWQVHIGEGSSEYREPVEFFQRTYLTESLRRLLVDAIRRLNSSGGNPVVQLQTNFGGGKTHSMLALYHLVSGVSPRGLLGLDQVMADAGVGTLPHARRVVLVGNKISPGNPSLKPDGTTVRTLWGELAWQLGGRDAYQRIAADDELATNPGDAIRELLVKYGPSLILIDEWVAYARQLHDEGDLPGGSFETQFTFAQALTESARLANNCLLVISLPASDTGASPTVVDDIEVGGARGREALHRLGNVIGRVESSWRPASAEEGFEIVRRRLFEPLLDPDSFTHRDVTARAFAELYRNQRSEFPVEASEAEYERRIRMAYPIHPEIFDRLYSDWSTLERFQRTRGVLRLMAAVIHSLWESDDRNPIILPATIPVDDSRVEFELTRYLPDSWTPIIASDVDGPNALPARLDAENANLGRYSATRRIARTIFLGSAPTRGAAHQGLEDRRIKLGSVMPGENPPIFGDALRRLAGQATYLFQDGNRYWYSTQANVTRLAEDRMEQLRRDPDRVNGEITLRMEGVTRERADFARVHLFPSSGADVPDDLETRLVILDLGHLHSREGGTPAEVFAREILETRGAGPRMFRNTLIFLAADRTRAEELQRAAGAFLAWESIVQEAESLNLEPSQKRQAEQRRRDEQVALEARIPEAFVWALIPTQMGPADPVALDAVRVSGGDTIVNRVSRKLRSDESMVASLGGTILARAIDQIPLWKGNHVAVRELVNYFAQYTYLQRITGPEVIVRAIQDGVASMTWATDGFAFADEYDEAVGVYRGLKAGQQIAAIDASSSALVVKPAVAMGQIAQAAADSAEAASKPTVVAGAGRATIDIVARGEGFVGLGNTAVRKLSYSGTVELTPERPIRDMEKIAQEVITHLVGLDGARVKVSLEIQAEYPEGFPEQVLRTVSENAATLKFTFSEFREE